ncbi:MFS transporter [Spongiactinospora rosea]|uniref:MFS transporter n=1 Tax=Spongiactinospora rosea TaxID=2248750 RepID=A0A366M2I6_9ACTN|nr:MFS transporter [Spongiactinospora rosea]RBQ19804.1 MFS transporter [Spongiactinospora rosea]
MASPSTLAPPVDPPRTARGVAVSVCAAPLITMVAYTAPMVTIPESGADLAATGSGPAWMLNAISLGLAATFLVVGVLADDYGRRRVYLAGTWVLALSALVSALAVNAPMFVAARLAAGAASAAMLAAGLGILGRAYPAGPRRAAMTGRYGAMLGLGIATGPLLSGGLTALWNWRGVHFTIAAASVVLAVMAARLLPAADEGGTARRSAPDVPGALTLALGATALLIAITEGRSGWVRPVVIASLVVAVALLTAFVLIERRRRAPLLDPALWRRPLFLVSTGGTLVIGVAVIGFMSYLPTALQLAHGISAPTTALLLSMWSGMSFLTALQSRRLRVRPAVLLAIGLLIAAAGALPLLGAAGPAPSWPRIALALAVSGAGSGLINAAVTHLAIESVPAARASMGAGANNTARYVGAAIGVAAMNALTGTLGLATAMNTGVIATAAIAALAAPAALALSRAASSAQAS